MSQLGQKAKYSLRVDVFRFSLETGHRPMGSACPIRANKRLMQRSRLHRYSIASSALASAQCPNRGRLTAVPLG